MYIVRFLHQTTTVSRFFRNLLSCISSVSYIKPQPKWLFLFSRFCCISSVSYIKPQPFIIGNSIHTCCISSVSYIKPQLSVKSRPVAMCCISSVSYIKPQLRRIFKLLLQVVYRPFPTSNHNWKNAVISKDMVVYRPFPTSNHNSLMKNYWMLVLYIVRFLHQTTTLRKQDRPIYVLYIVRFLHQTTTKNN